MVSAKPITRVLQIGAKPAARVAQNGTIGIPNTADHVALALTPGAYEAQRQVEWSDAQEPRVVLPYPNKYAS